MTWGEAGGVVEGHKDPGAIGGGDGRLPAEPAWTTQTVVGSVWGGDQGSAFQPI